MSEKQYKVVDGTSYDVRTSDAIVAVLESARKHGRRVRVRYGDTATGRDWLEEHDVEGRISRSTGSIKIPLLIPNSRSTGGTGLLDHCIVRIVDSQTHRVLYSHEQYNRPTLTLGPAQSEGYAVAAFADGVLHAQFRTQRAGERWIARQSL